MELGTFKRLEEGKIALDGLVWCNDPEKAVEFINEKTGLKAHSVKFEDVYYYPCGVYIPKKSKK